MNQEISKYPIQYKFEATFLIKVRTTYIYSPTTQKIS